ncbi:MAG TPA: hypothetical protein VLG28_15755 [Acidimicrobiia bacterium]|jgi:hypothetical protein|nr:hypothetical protein [Acidimicrobiia bacterium]
MSGDATIELIEASDLDGLVRRIDGLCTHRDWEEVERLIARCQDAVERGKQVWGAVHYAEYRLALEAPAELAASVVKPGAGRHAAGPLWEVAASTHTWDELAPFVADPHVRALVAAERALRGDAVPLGEVGPVAEIPLHPVGWEPAYGLATYRSDGVDMPGPDLPELAWSELPAPAPSAADPDACDALLDVVRPWLDESSGRGEALAVEGSAEQAIRGLGPHRVRMADADLGLAMQVMAFAGASGGAFGRRRGTPAGRTAAWWAVATLVGMEEDWPVDPEALGREGAALRWVVWDPGDQVGGWVFHLAVEDPDVGLAWVVSAVDAH